MCRQRHIAHNTIVPTPRPLFIEFFIIQQHTAREKQTNSQEHAQQFSNRPTSAPLYHANKLKLVGKKSRL